MANVGRAEAVESSAHAFRGTPGWRNWENERYRLGEGGLNEKAIGNVNADELILAQTAKRRIIQKRELDCFGRMTPAAPREPCGDNEQHSPEKQDGAVFGEKHDNR